MGKKTTWPMLADDGDDDANENVWGIDKVDGEPAAQWPSQGSGALVPAGAGGNFGLALPKPKGKYPVQALTGSQPLWYDADRPAVVSYSLLARRLSEVGDVYRRPGRGEGLVVVPSCPGEPPQEVTTGSQLGVVITDRLPLVVVKNGKPKGNALPQRDLNNMVRSELFLTWFRPLDRVAELPEYLRDFELTGPGYNDCGEGHRVYYCGPKPEVRRSRDAVDRFLDVMAFASDADRTNAVAAALTVTLRPFWPGEKPVVLVTSTKSHGGKDTVLGFASGETLRASVSYEPTDWAFQRACELALKQDARVGLLDVGNVRRENRGGEIKSAFLERFLTDPRPLLNAPGTGPAVWRSNHWVVAMTTNQGVVSTDVMNRALPIHLTPRGDVRGRKTKIGDPKQYLRNNRGLIAAELRGLIARWKEAGCPSGETGGHAMRAWAAAVGGILEVNGYSNFLANYPARLTADDGVRGALGLLGINIPKSCGWVPAKFLLGGVAHLGLTARLIAKDDRESPASRERALAKVLDAHAEETFLVEKDGGAVWLRLDRQPPSPNGGTVTLYRFSLLPSQGS